MPALPDSVSNKGNDFSLSELEFRDNSKDHLYWKQYGTVVDVNTNKIWDALTIALEKYKLAVAQHVQWHTSYIYRVY